MGQSFIEKGNALFLFEKSDYLNPTKNFIRKNLGNTLYKVSIQFSKTSTERIDEKIMRLANNDVAKILESPIKKGAANQ